MTPASGQDSRVFVPLRGVRSPGVLAGLFLAGVVAVARAAHAEVPMVPVPMSLQTYAVVLLGGLAGWRLGGSILLFYLLCGALGAPVFAGGASGIKHLMGPTAGYLFGFVLAASLVGALAERGWTSSLGRSSLAMVAGHGVTLAAGAAVLSLEMGVAQAFQRGVQPFLLGGLLKSILAAGTLLLLKAFLARQQARLGQAP